MAKPTVRTQKITEDVNVGTVSADITKLQTQDPSGNFRNFFRVNDPFKIHLDLTYPEVLSDVHAPYTVRVICIQLAPSLGIAGAYSHVYEAQLEPDTTALTVDFDHTALDPGAGPGIYFLVATFDFGPSSSFGAYQYGNIFFVGYIKGQI